MCHKTKSALWLATLVVAGAANTVLCQVPDKVQPKSERPQLAVGDLLPTFESIDDTGNKWNSAEHIGKSIVVMYFYPGDFTGGCIRQAQTYRDGLDEIEGNCALLVGVSGDEVATHKLFRETFGLKHRLLADPSGKLAKQLGIPAKPGGRVSAVTPERKRLHDAEGKAIVIERPVTLARWTIVIDLDGRIASMR
ncbi:MAG: peroxiredoxin, partial [Aureliella sp.]